jgi:hypothetical protein
MERYNPLGLALAELYAMIMTGSFYCWNARLNVKKAIEAAGNQSTQLDFTQFLLYARFG